MMIPGLSADPSPARDVADNIISDGTKHGYVPDMTIVLGIEFPSLSDEITKIQQGLDFTADDLEQARARVNRGVCVRENPMPQRPDLVMPWLLAKYFVTGDELRTFVGRTYDGWQLLGGLPEGASMRSLCSNLGETILQKSKPERILLPLARILKENAQILAAADVLGINMTSHENQQRSPQMPGDKYGSFVWVMRQIFANPQEARRWIARNASWQLAEGLPAIATNGMNSLYFQLTERLWQIGAPEKFFQALCNSFPEWDDEIVETARKFELSISKGQPVPAENGVQQMPGDKFGALAWLLHNHFSQRGMMTFVRRTLGQSTERSLATGGGAGTFFFEVARRIDREGSILELLKQILAFYPNSDQEILAVGQKWGFSPNRIRQ